jgi:hypothetical protein
MVTIAVVDAQSKAEVNLVKAGIKGIINRIRKTSR